MDTSEVINWLAIDKEQKIPWLLTYLSKKGVVLQSYHQNEIENEIARWVASLPDSYKMLSNIKSAWYTQKSRNSGKKVSIAIDKAVRSKLYTLSNHWQLPVADVLVQIVGAFVTQNKVAAAKEKESKAIEKQVRELREKVASRFNRVTVTEDPLIKCRSDFENLKNEFDVLLLNQCRAQILLEANGLKITKLSLEQENQAISLFEGMKEDQINKEH